MITAQDVKDATLYVNGQDVSMYGVLVESFSVGGTAISNEVYQGRNRTAFNVIASTFGRRSISVSLFFCGKTRRDLTMTKSKVDSLFFGPLELFLPDGFYYTSVLSSAGEMAILGPQGDQVMALCKYDFDGIRHDPLETVTGNVVRCLSTMPYTDCRLTCTASEAYDSITIATVTITGVAEGDVLVVDGINGRILQNGAPCAGNMSFTHFPTLIPGVNTLACPETLTVEYYPTYI